MSTRATVAIEASVAEELVRRLTRGIDRERFRLGKLSTNTGSFQFEAEIEGELRTPQGPQIVRFDSDGNIETNLGLDIHFKRLVVGFNLNRAIGTGSFGFVCLVKKWGVCWFGIPLYVPWVGHIKVTINRVNVPLMALDVFVQAEEILAQEIDEDDLIAEANLAFHSVHIGSNPARLAQHFLDHIQAGITRVLKNIPAFGSLLKYVADIPLRVTREVLGGMGLVREVENHLHAKLQDLALGELAKHFESTDWIKVGKLKRRFELTGEAPHPQHPPQPAIHLDLTRARLKAQAGCSPVEVQLQLEA